MLLGSQKSELEIAGLMLLNIRLKVSGMLSDQMYSLNAPVSNLFPISTETCNRLHYL